MGFAQYGVLMVESVESGAHPDRAWAGTLRFSARLPRFLRSTSACPACFSTIVSSPCRTCGLDFTHPATAELAGALDAHRRRPGCPRRPHRTHPTRDGSARPCALAPRGRCSTCRRDRGDPVGGRGRHLRRQPRRASTPSGPVGPASAPRERRSSIQIALVIVGVSLLSVFAAFGLRVRLRDLRLDRAHAHHRRRHRRDPHRCRCALSTRPHRDRGGVSPHWAPSFSLLDAWALRLNDPEGLGAVPWAGYWGVALLVVGVIATPVGRAGGDWRAPQSLPRHFFRWVPHSPQRNSSPPSGGPESSRAREVSRSFVASCVAARCRRPERRDRESLAARDPSCNPRSRPRLRGHRSRRRPRQPRPTSSPAPARHPSSGPSFSVCSRSRTSCRSPARPRARRTAFDTVAAVCDRRRQCARRHHRHDPHDPPRRSGAGDREPAPARERRDRPHRRAAVATLALGRRVGAPGSRAAPSFCRNRRRHRGRARRRHRGLRVRGGRHDQPARAAALRRGARSPHPSPSCSRRWALLPLSAGLVRGELGDPGPTALAAARPGARTRRAHRSRGRPSRAALVARHAAVRHPRRRRCSGAARWAAPSRRGRSHHAQLRTRPPHRRRGDRCGRNRVGRAARLDHRPDDHLAGHLCSRAKKIAPHRAPLGARVSHWASRRCSCSARRERSIASCCASASMRCRGGARAARRDRGAHGPRWGGLEAGRTAQRRGRRPSRRSPSRSWWAPVVASCTRSHWPLSPPRFVVAELRAGDRPTRRAERWASRIAIPGAVTLGHPLSPGRVLPTVSAAPCRPRPPCRHRWSQPNSRRACAGLTRRAIDSATDITAGTPVCSARGAARRHPPAPGGARVAVTQRWALLIAKRDSPR